jgi:sugar lactone lactonase YvrE
VQAFKARGCVAAGLVLSSILALSACGGGGAGGPSGTPVDGTAAPSVPVPPAVDAPSAPVVTVSVFAGLQQAAGSDAAAGAGNVDAQGTAARFNSPNGLAASADGALLVGDEGNNVVRRIDASGAVSTLAASFPVFNAGNNFSSSPTSHVALDDQGTAYVTGDNVLGTNAVYAIGSSGQVRTVAKFQEVTTSLAPAPGGQLYVGTQGTVVVLNADGSRNRTIAGTSCSESAMAFGGPVLYLACPGGSVVRSLNAQGVSVIVAGQQSKPGNVDGDVASSRLDSPSAVAVDPSGNLYIADARSIRRVGADGGVRTIAVLANASTSVRVKALVWSRGMLYATVPHAVLRIGPVN